MGWSGWPWVGQRAAKSGQSYSYICSCLPTRSHPAPVFLCDVVISAALGLLRVSVLFCISQTLKRKLLLRIPAFALTPGLHRDREALNTSTDVSCCGPSVASDVQIPDLQQTVTGRVGLLVSQCSRKPGRGLVASALSAVPASSEAMLQEWGEQDTPKLQCPLARERIDPRRVLGSGQETTQPTGHQVPGTPTSLTEMVKGGCCSSPAAEDRRAQQSSFPLLLSPLSEPAVTDTNSTTGCWSRRRGDAGGSWGADVQGARCLHPAQ